MTGYQSYRISISRITQLLALTKDFLGTNPIPFYLLSMEKNQRTHFVILNQLYADSSVSQKWAYLAWESGEI